MTPDELTRPPTKEDRIVKPQPGKNYYLLEPSSNVCRMVEQ